MGSGSLLPEEGKASEAEPPGKGTDERREECGRGGSGMTEAERETRGVVEVVYKTEEGRETEEEMREGGRCELRRRDAQLQRQVVTRRLECPT